MYKKTKIVCTLGPSSNTPDILAKMIQAGMNVARFNFSHGSHAEHKQRIEMVRNVARNLNVPVALMLDTKGPEIRLGLFKNGSVELVEGHEFTLTARDVEGDETIASMSYKDLPKEVKAGDHILLSDGLVNLVVTSVEGDDIHTKILNSGKMSDRKRVAVPGIAINLPAVSETDEADIEFGIHMNMDWIAASFIQRGKDVLTIRRILENHDSHMKIISKIECKAAVDNIDEIISMSDGIMVARGDLGVEVPAEEVPTLQKLLIHKCQMAGKPVITATQMLESMCSNPRPTRAETSDVANAILDGTDAVMLSGETAGGLYPVEAVQTMARVATYTESQFPPRAYVDENAGSATTTESIGKATVKIAQDLHAAAIIASTERGGTAQMVSKYRPTCPIIAVSTHENIVRRLQMNWGIQAILGQEGNTTDEVVDNAIYAALDAGIIKAGDLVVRAAGTEYVDYMKRASAIISEEAGLTSESAIVAITFGIPTIVGAAHAADLLENGEVVTVDAGRGTIFRGKANAR